jgi:thiol:disulfide interchange protein DsbD
MSQFAVTDIVKSEDKTTMRYQSRLRLIVLFTLISILCLGAVPATAQFGGLGEEAQSILMTETFVSLGAAAPGDTVWIAVRLELEPSWHVNSANPLQDGLIATELAIETPAHLTAGEIRYPQGSVIPLLGESMSVFESGATIFVPLTVASDAPPGPTGFTGSLLYQGCDDNLCLGPEEAPLRWVVKVSSPRGIALHPAVFAPVLDAGSSSISSSDWIKTDGSSAREISDLERLINEHGTWGYVLAFLLAFGTGLLLSFSPCTYPMIPITVSIFAGQARGPGRGFVLSSVYVLTMAVIYGIMGTVVASVGGVFGAWLAHPAVVGTIVAIFVIFSLSMFGLFELQVPERMRSKMAGKGGQGIGGAIVLGAVAALVVSPCVGPFVAGIMLYVATSGSAFLGFSILFVFALGLGTLFLIIGTFSSAINALPNAGMWMESVKKFFGFILLVMALYFLRTLISTELTALLAGLLAMVTGVFVGGFDRLTDDSGFFPRLKKAFGILAFVLGIYFFGGYLLFSGVIWPPLGSVGVGSLIPGGGHEEKIPWQTDLDAGLKEAQLTGKPVLIDTWATWCVNCKRLDQVTWSDDRVAAEATRFVPLKIQLERGSDPITKQFLALFKLKQYSLPTIILINSTGQIEVIQGFVDAEKMLARMRAVS